ncbi:G protein-regulated inducer of neurite outgrowth 3 [Ctenodactylus gundi]
MGTVPDPLRLAKSPLITAPGREEALGVLLPTSARHCPAQPGDDTHGQVDGAKEVGPGTEALMPACGMSSPRASNVVEGVSPVSCAQEGPQPAGCSQPAEPAPSLILQAPSALLAQEQSPHAGTGDSLGRSQCTPSCGKQALAMRPPQHVNQTGNRSQLPASPPGQPAGFPRKTGQGKEPQPARQGASGFKEASTMTASSRDVPCRARQDAEVQAVASVQSRAVGTSPSVLRPDGGSHAPRLTLGPSGDLPGEALDPPAQDPRGDGPRAGVIPAGEESTIAQPLRASDGPLDAGSPSPDTRPSAAAGTTSGGPGPSGDCGRPGPEDAPPTAGARGCPRTPGEPRPAASLALPAEAPGSASPGSGPRTPGRAAKASPRRASRVGELLRELNAGLAPGERRRQAGTEAGPQPKPSRRVRDVEWDEQGMTWEVYGASLDPECLGAAIQSHLQRQIRERERAARTPGPARRSVSLDASCKRPAGRRRGVLRGLLRGLRRPACCARPAPANALD